MQETLTGSLQAVNGLAFDIELGSLPGRKATLQFHHWNIVYQTLRPF
jgi:hypothetical protein